jgi:hypothetical protein
MAGIYLFDSAHSDSLVFFIWSRAILSTLILFLISQTSKNTTMSEPDELYTLRAQYWLGHYSLAMEEAKSVMRRPMSPELKVEREELGLRAQLGLGQRDKVISAAQASGSAGT